MHNWMNSDVLLSGEKLLLCHHVLWIFVFQRNISKIIWRVAWNGDFAKTKALFPEIKSNVSAYKIDLLKLNDCCSLIVANAN